MKKKKSLLCALLLATAAGAQAQVTISVDANDKGAKVSPTLYGIFFEEINHGGEGGLYAELLQNRSFEDKMPAPRRPQEAGKPAGPQPIPGWSAVGGAQIKLTQDGLLNSAQGNALHVKTAKGQTAGIQNEGFWGINAVQGRTYQLSFWLRAKKSFKGTLTAPTDAARSWPPCSPTCTRVSCASPADAMWRDSKAPTTPSAGSAPSAP